MFVENRRPRAIKIMCEKKKRMKKNRRYKKEK
jgi:hypothetical protein